MPGTEDMGWSVSSKTLSDDRYPVGSVNPAADLAACITLMTDADGTKGSGEGALCPLQVAQMGRDTQPAAAGVQHLDTQDMP